MKTEKQLEKRIKTIVIIITILLFIFCIYMIYIENKNYEEYEEKAGLIIDKMYIPPETKTKKENNTIITYVEQPKYQLKIEKEINGEKKSIWIYVTEAEYNNYGIEDYYGVSN